MPYWEAGFQVHGVGNQAHCVTGDSVVVNTPLLDQYMGLAQLVDDIFGVVSFLWRGSDLLNSL
jgi:hypothetical protein